MNINLNKLVASSSSLAPLPVAVSKLNELADNPDTTIEQIDAIVTLDPVLTAQILKVANSAFYGFSKQINTIRQALIILGFRTLRNIAIGSSLLSYQEKINYPPPLNANDFWLHSLATACISKVVSKHLKIHDADEMFVIGLIHDIGKLILLKSYPNEYQQIIEEARFGHNRSLHTLEESFFGCHHGMVGQEVCVQWNFPQIYALAARYHHESHLDAHPIQPHDKMVISILRFSNNLSKILMKGYGGNCMIEPNYTGLLIDKIHKTNVNLMEEIFNEIINAQMAFNFKNSIKPFNNRAPYNIIIYTTRTSLSKIILYLTFEKFESSAIMENLDNLPNLNSTFKTLMISDLEESKLTGILSHLNATYINLNHFSKDASWLDFCHIYEIQEYIESKFT